MLSPNISIIKDIWRDTLSLLYPRVCAGCDKTLVKGEEVLCVDCLLHIPMNNSTTERNNWVEKLFLGRVQVQYAMSLCEFRSHTRVQQVLHTIKYHNRPDVASYMGAWMGSYLKESVFKTCDLIIPVPLHPHRLKTRGFNQSEYLSEGISRILQIPINTDTLYRQIANVSQTHKSRYDRWSNVKNIFALRDEKTVRGKHVMLVDDVITTGATIEACAHVLLTVQGTKVSIATLACAMQ